MASPNDFYVQPGGGLGESLSGLSGTLGQMREEKARQAERQRLLDEEAAREQRIQERFTAAKNAAQQALASGDPDKMAEVTLEYPEIGQGLSQAFGIVDANKKQQASGFVRNLVSDPSQADQIYQARIEEIQSRGGDPKDTIRSYEAFRRNPEGELKNLQFMWAAMDKDSYGAYRDEQREAQKAALDREKLARDEARFYQSEANKDRRAAMRGAAGSESPSKVREFEYYQQLKRENPEEAKAYGRGAGFVNKQGEELSSHLQKRLSVATDEAIQAEADIGRFEALADEIEASDLDGGVPGAWKEAAKELTGSQDAVSDLRRQFNGIKSSQVVRNLPPGAASDADIALALSGFPTDRANKQQLSGFLRGMAKLQQMNANFNNYKAEYISQNGHERGMLKSWNDGAAESAQTASSAPAQPESQAIEVTSQEQFDALPSGAVFFEDGVQYRKP